MERLPEAGDWDGFWKNTASAKGRPSFAKQRVMAFLRPYLKAGGRALDAGCGSGFFSAFFCEGGLQTTALDYSPVSLEKARAATGGRVQILQADLLKDDLQRHGALAYDLIFSDGLFEHFIPEDQDRIMGRLRASLAPGGVIVTIVPNRYSPWQLIRPLYMPGIEEDPFTRKRLLDLNTRNGLEVLCFEGLNTWPWRLSPEGAVAGVFGMLLATVSKARPSLA